MTDFLQCLVPDWTGVCANVGALSTLRVGGISPAPYDDGAGAGGLNLGMHVGDDPAAVQENRLRLRALLPSEPVWLNQVHGNAVVDAARVEGIPTADASFTARPGVVCVIQTADCLPVLLCDADAKVVGAAHAGWRGLASGVLENTIAAMRNAGARQILAWLGPAIGPQRFEVGPEVRQAFMDADPNVSSAFASSGTGEDKYLADIYSLAHMRLRRSGIEQIFGAGFCTVTDSTRFYSFRRDKTTGRMASCIWLKD